MKTQNKNMMERILIANSNKNKADFNEELFTGTCGLPVQVVDKNRYVGVELSQLQF